jgi:hypothetical protein
MFKTQALWSMRGNLSDNYQRSVAFDQLGIKIIDGINRASTPVTTESTEFAAEAIHVGGDHENI